MRAENPWDIEVWREALESLRAGIVGSDVRSVLVRDVAAAQEVLLEAVVVHVDEA